MKKIMSVISVMILVFLVGCSNSEIQRAIDECKEDPECYVIIDEAIDEELESRGITGGTMTSTELELVYDMLERYISDDFLVMNWEDNIGVDQWFEEAIIGFESYGILNDLDRIETYHTSLNYFYGMEYDAEQYLNLRTINTENKQHFIHDDVKYIIFKTGKSTYTYEVFADNKYTFEIDTELDALYYDGAKLINHSEILYDFFNISTDESYMDIKFENNILAYFLNYELAPDIEDNRDEGIIYISTYDLNSTIWSRLDIYRTPDDTFQVRFYLEVYNAQPSQMMHIVEIESFTGTLEELIAHILIPSNIVSESDSQIEGGVYLFDNYDYVLQPFYDLELSLN